MRRRELIAALGGTAGWPIVARGQQPKVIPRLCFITFDPGTLRTRSPRYDAFFEGLSELGYVDGQTIAIDYLSTDGRNEQYPALVGECLSHKPNIIAVTTTPGAQVLKDATREIPIVLVAVGDPLGSGLVSSLGQPGGNVTGMSTMVSDLAAKRLSILKEVVPSLSRVLVLTFLADPIALLQIKAMREAASSLNVALQIQDIRTADDLPAAFEAGARDRVDGLLITAESMFTVNRARVSELAARYRLPAIYPFSISVIEGEGLMSYDADVRELHRRAAVYVDRILKGARAGDLPIQQPAKFKLVVNVKTAKALGLTIPPSILSRADQVIE